MSNKEITEHDDIDSQILALMRKLYPTATEEQLIEGKQNLEEYVETAWKIAERMERESRGGDFDSGQQNSYDDPTKVELRKS